METPRLRHDTSESSETTDNSTDKHTSLYSLKLLEYSPLKHILDLIPLKAQRLLNTFDVNFLSLDVTTEFVAVGSSIGTLYLYERQTGNLQRYRYEDYVGDITTVRLYEGLHSLVSFGTENGRVIVFTIPTGGSLTKAHRYDIVNVHTHPITALEWNDNGYHLYSGDKSGLVVETEFDLIRKLCKSREMLKEPWSVVELKIGGTTLAISTLQRALLYDLTEGGVAMLQIGKRERKSYGKYGIIFNSSNTVITSRPGLRLWKADLNGTVLETMLIKKSLEILDHHSIILLKNDCPKLDEKIPREIEKSPQFEKLLIFQDIFILTWNNDAIFIIDPETAKVVGSSRGFEGKILDVATHRNEIFILEEPRKIRRLGIEPEEIMYPQINIPRSGKDEFSFLSAMNLPFHRLVKKSSESNEENTSEKSSKVLSWIKKLTGPDKVETPDEARLFDNTPMNEIKQAATLTDTENTNLVVYQQAMKRNSKKKHKDYVDGSKLEKSSEDFQWDNYQSRSPKSAHYFPLDESLEDDKKELFDNQESPALRFNNIENEEERLERILKCYETAPNQKIDVEKMTNDSNDNVKFECEEIKEDNINNDEGSVNPTETSLTSLQSPACDIYSHSSPKFNREATISDDLNLISNDRLSPQEDNVEVAESENKNNNSTVAFHFEHSIDEWLQHKLPTLTAVANISVNFKYVYIVDAKENVFFSHLNSDVLIWKSMDFSASQIAISELSDYILILHRKILYSSVLLKNGKPKFPLINVATKVTSISLDKDTAWFISNGKLMYLDLEMNSSQSDYKLNVVPNHPLFPKHVCCCENIVWLSTHELKLFSVSVISQTCTSESTYERKTIKLPTGIKEISSITLSRNGTGWIVDEFENVFIKTNVNTKNPCGSGSWYRMEINQFHVFPYGARKANNISIKNQIKQIMPDLNKSTIASSSKGIFFYNGCSLLTSRDSISIHKWELFRPGTGIASNFKWSTITSSGMNSKEDPIWAVYATGELFCFNEVNAQPLSVSIPCSGRNTFISCLAACPGVLWALTTVGSIHVRNEISSTCITGTHWSTLDEAQIDFLSLAQLSCSKDIVWACDKSSCVWVRVGPVFKTKNLAPAWINLEEIDDHKLSLTMVSVGSDPSLVWAITANGVVYVRKGVTTEMPIGVSWELVPGVEAKCIAASKITVWVLAVNGDVYYRYGIDSTNASGDAWIKIPGSFEHLTVSPRNCLWALDGDGNTFRLATVAIEFDSERSIHARNTNLEIAPEMGEEWEVL